MEIIIGLFFLFFIGYILIRLWIKFVNLIMNPLIKREKYKEEKLQFVNQNEDLTNTQKNDKFLDIKKAVENFDNNEKFKKLGVFNKINHIKEFIPEYQLKHFDDQFYFKNYDKADGEWINKEDILCYVYTSSNQKFEPIYSSKSGYLEHIKKHGDKLFENDELSIIHKEGEYENENSPLKKEYKHYGINDVYKWFVSDGDYVKINDSIYQYEDSNDNVKMIRAKKEGFIDIEFLETDYIYRDYKKYLIFTIREDDIIRQNKKYINIPNIFVDDFSKSKIIKWKEVSSLYPKDEQKLQGIISKSDNHLVDLFFTFNYLNNRDYIIFHFNPKQIRPIKNDKICFLFKNDKKIIFNLYRNPIPSKNNKSENVLEIKFILTNQELDLLANQNLKKWKIVLKKGEIEILGGNFGEVNNYKSKSNLNIVIKKFAKDYIKLLNTEIENYQPTEIRKKDTIEIYKDKICYVYLMKDTSNNYYKIGISNRPKYREKTLQSEKPTIELLISKKFPVRKMAESFEKALHETYSESRIRGEWFDLTEKEIENIIATLS